MDVYMGGTALDISQYRTKETTSKLVIPTTHHNGSCSSHYSQGPNIFHYLNMLFLKKSSFPLFLVIPY